MRIRRPAHPRVLRKANEFFGIFLEAARYEAADLLRFRAVKKWRRGESNHLGEKRRSPALTASYLTTAASDPAIILARTSSLFRRAGLQVGSTAVAETGAWRRGRATARAGPHQLRTATVAESGAVRDVVAAGRT